MVIDWCIKTVRFKIKVKRSTFYLTLSNYIKLMIQDIRNFSYMQKVYNKFWLTQIHNGSIPYDFRIDDVNLSEKINRENSFLNIILSPYRETSLIG